MVANQPLPSSDRQSFLLALSDRLRRISDPYDLMRAATEMVGRQMVVNRVGFCDVEEADGTMFYPVGWSDGVLEPLSGRAPIHSLLGGASIARFRAGQTASIADVEQDDDLDQDRFAARGTRALLAVPLVRDGDWVASLFVNHATVRDWTEEDAELLEGVLVRTWEAIERARAETMLRRTQARQAFLYDLIAQQRQATDIEEVLRTAAMALGQFLGVDRAGFFDLSGRKTLVFTQGWCGGRLPTLSGTFDIRRVGASILKAITSAQVLAWADSRADPLVSDTPLGEIGSGAGICTLIARYGVWRSVLFVDTAEPRRWLTDEVSLVREVSDITWDAVERLRARNSLAEANAALEAANVNLEGRVATALAKQAETEEALRQAQKLEAVGQLTGGVAHDFNNLLTVIRSSCDLLKRPNLDAERRARYVAAISDTVDRAAKLTGQLLAFARRQALRPEVFDAGESVRTISDMVGTLMGSRISVITELPDAPCFINADPSQFDTALVNMAINARDAMNGEGQLTVRVRAVEGMPAIREHPAASGPFVAVSLTDTGAGIPPERLETIFEPFFTTKVVGQGTGLGLSQVYGFSKQSGGEIMVSSAVERGSTFTLYLPRVEGEVRTIDRGEPEPLADGHGTRVLLVEDNIEVGAFATQTLSELGYVTVWAANANEALAELAADHRSFDVVFTDVIMPGMSGIEFAQQVRDKHGDLPVVLTSGYSHVLAQHGTHGFELLSKPYSVEQLSRVLRKVVIRERRKRLMIK